jgi:hypothetical protein
VTAVMPGAPLERPKRGTVLRAFAGTVAAPPASVFDAVLQRVRPARPEGGNLSTDPQARLIVVQGGWWYRAEYRVSADPGGSRLDLTLVNVAEPAHWLGPFTGRAVLRASPAAFERLVRELARDLE